MRGPSHYSFISFARMILISMVALLIGGTIYLAQAGTTTASGNSNDAVIIPQDSIRIRIIAQSDSEEDQAIKRAVRDQVADLIVSWGEMPSTLSEARDFIEARLDEVQSTTDRTLREVKASYGAKIELAKVPFPEKTFKGKDYPAADYEALRITLGEGEGANWWCVLFPPLCLTAATSQDEASAATEPAQTSAPTKQTAKESGKTAEKTASVSKAKAQSQGQANDQDQAQEEAEKPHAEFFLWVILKKLFAFIASLF
ncbi:stage II sporulation protein R [Cohnella sp. AR92]|uniref:stage II sporulation protein R n=1 Tax=Cohnella sp. AR92 TaxID=648716 RepID=UPI000F8E46F2|nr:stage II sporulation protein R [Cohnella sp. AR92]RUS49149.1 stage II sporulation protein R [Cohnella sp. AR92]